MFIPNPLEGICHLGESCHPYISGRSVKKVLCEPNLVHVYLQPHTARATPTFLYHSSSRTPSIFLHFLHLKGNWKRPSTWWFGDLQSCHTGMCWGDRTVCCSSSYMAIGSCVFNLRHKLQASPQKSIHFSYTVFFFFLNNAPYSSHLLIYSCFMWFGQGLPLGSTCMWLGE